MAKRKTTTSTTDELFLRSWDQPAPAPPLPACLAEVPAARLDDLYLEPAARWALVDVVKGHRLRDKLRAHGLEPVARILFHGPPGCGKTVAARALAGALGLPVFVARFDSLIDSHMGETAKQLASVFAYAGRREAVVLLDEVDAVARRRGRSDDVGEANRIVVALLQQFDLVQPAGLIIAATNAAEDLDPALARRFDLELEFPLPSREALEAYCRRVAAARGVSMERCGLGAAASYADAERCIVAEQRRMIIADG